MPQSHCKLNDLNWCCLNPLLECMAAPLPCSNSSTHMTRQSAKFTIWASQHSPTTGGFTCQVFFSERQDYKVLAASRLRTDQEVFYYQTNYISSVFLKKMSIIRYLIQKMRTLPQNWSWNPIWWVLSAFTVNSSVLMN